MNYVILYNRGGYVMGNLGVKRFLGIFLVIILCIPNSVKAEGEMSNDFKKYLNEDLKFEINGTVAKNEFDFFQNWLLQLLKKNCGMKV